MQMVTVAKMMKTVDYNGQKYGPSDGPISVPLDLAVAYNLQPLGGETLAPASLEAQAQEVAAAQNLASQFQRNLDLLLIQIRPHAADGETPDQTLERLLREREQGHGAQRKVSSLEDIISRGKADNERLIREGGDQRTRLAELTKERDELQTRLADVAKERDDAHQALAATTSLPPREKTVALISTVKRVSDEMAAEIYELLTNPPAESE